MRATPVFALGPLLLILALIGLFIFLIVRLAKGRPAVIAWIVGGFVALFLLSGLSVVGLAPRPAGPGLRLPGGIEWIVLGLLAAIVIALVKGGKPVRIAIGVLALLALLALPFLVLFVARVHVARDVAWQQQQGGAWAPVTAEPAIWHDGVVDQYTADVYPSRRSAAQALGVRVSAAVDEMLPGLRDNTRVRFVPNDANPGIVEAMAEGYGTRGGKWTVSPQLAPEEEVSVDLQIGDVQTIDAPWTPSGVRTGGADMTVLAPVQTEHADSGTFRAIIHAKDGRSTTVAADFFERPWVENMAAFLARDPKRQFTLARSYQSCTSREEARAQAISAACDAVSSILRGTQAQPMMKVDMAAHEADLNSAGMIVDRFTQRLSGGMTGAIWREAVLVDVSDAKMQELAQRKIAIARAERTTWAKMGLTLAGMFAVISVVYLFLNAATRGYYTWALRVAVVVLMGAGVFFLLLTA